MLPGSLGFSLVALCSTLRFNQRSIIGQSRWGLALLGLRKKLGFKGKKETPTSNAGPPYQGTIMNTCSAACKELNREGEGWVSSDGVRCLSSLSPIFLIFSDIV